MAMASSTERGGRSPSIIIPLAMRVNSRIRALMPSMARSWRSGRQQTSAGLDVPDGKLVEIGLQIGLIAGFGFAQRIDQHIGDFGHRGDHDHHRAVGMLLGRKTGGGPDAIGRAHARAAEFHNQKIIHDSPVSS